MLPVAIPPGLTAQAALGRKWAEWLERLPSLAAGLLEEWELGYAGGARHGYCSLVLPVRTAGGRPAMLKIALPDEQNQHEHLALQRWQGNGTVQLLRADPHRFALLLERLHPHDLGEVWDVEACEIVAGLYRRLHVPGPAPASRPLDLRRPLDRRPGRAAQGRTAAASARRSGRLPRSGLPGRRRDDRHDDPRRPALRKRPRR